MSTRVNATITSLSWIPSEAVTGVARSAFETGLAHYDAPPPDAINDLQALQRRDGFRYANVLSGWVEVEDGRIVDAGYGDDSDVNMGSTTVRVGRLCATFAAVALPTLRQEPVFTAEGAARFVQTCGGRTALPMPRTIPHPPYVKLQAPWVWTTLALTLYPDGRSEVGLVGASTFPRHWVYDATGTLVAKSGLTDWADWQAHSFGRRTPWGEDDSRALMVAAETAGERVLSRMLMAEAKPRIVSYPSGHEVTRQRAVGNELMLLLDGVLAVEVDGRRLAELGPGAVVGERAILEGGRRTSTLIAVTPVRVAIASSDAINRERLAELAKDHRREEATQT